MGWGKFIGTAGLFGAYDKFVTEIAILHEKSGNETIFITAKNERLL